MTRIAIIGGGLSGLSTAWNLLNLENTEITVFEAEGRPGGKIQSTYEDGFLYEHGPNGFMDSRQEMVDFCLSLGLEERMVQSNDSAAERYILRGGKLRRLPKKPPQILTWSFLPFTAKLRLMTEPFRGKSKAEDETVYDFCCRRLGKTVAEYLVDPFTSGVFGADCRQLSVRAAFPALWKMEQEYGCLFKGLKAKMKANKGKKQGKLSSFKGGMQDLIDALVNKMEGRITLQLNTAVDRIRREDGKTFIDIQGQEPQQFDLVVTASPAYATGKILRELYPDLSRRISAVPYSALTVVPQGFKSLRPDKLNAFGFLVPSKEKSQLLGTLYDSSIFPYRSAENCHSIRTMLGGGKNPEIINFSDEEVFDLILRENRQVLGIENKADFSRIIRWQKAIPVYELGHCRLIEDIEKAVANEPLFVTGNAFYGVSMNDCVSAAAKTAEQVRQYLEK